MTGGPARRSLGDLSRRRRRTNGRAAGFDFDSLYQRHYVAMLRAAMAISLDLEVAREITQEAFMRLWERRDRLAEDSNEEAWLMRVTVNLAISHRRGWLRGLRHRSVSEASADPAALAIRNLEADGVRTALQKLRPRERALLALRYGRGLSFAEIGALLDQAEGTVRMSCHRSLEKLRANLNDWVVDESLGSTGEPEVVNV